MNAQASVTSAWYAAVVNPATTPPLKARCRIKCARGMPCAAASAFNRARSSPVTLILISGIWLWWLAANRSCGAVLTLLTVSYGERKTPKPSCCKGFAPLLTFLTVKKVYTYREKPPACATLLPASLIGDMFPETVRNVRNVRTRFTTGLAGLTPSYGQALWIGILTARPLSPVPRK